LVGSDESPTLARNLQIELTAQGFEPILLDTARPGQVTDVGQSVADSHAVGAIWIPVGGEGRLEVWVPDSGGTPVQRELTVTRSDDARVVATSAVELLRANLRELDSRRDHRKLEKERRAAMPGLAPLPPDAAAPAERSGPRWGLALGPAITTSPGGLGASLGVQPELRLWLSDTTGISAFGLVPLMNESVSAEEGNAELQIYVIGAGPRLRLLPHSLFGADISAGLLAAIMPMKGAATAPLEGVSDTATAAGAFGAVSLSYRLSHTVSVYGVGTLGRLFEEVEVRFADRAAASWGNPFGQASLGIAVLVP
jgi:hypothetical protein